MTRSILGALGVLLVLTQCGFAQNAGSSRLLRLKAETVNTSARANLLDQDPLPVAFDQARYVLQLDAAITPARRAQLEQAGVRLGDYLPDHAYIADLTAADPAKLAGLGFVQWAGPFEQNWKIDPRIGQRLNAFQTADRIALAQAGMYKLVVTLFDGMDLQGAAARLQQAGATVTGSEVVGDGGEIFVTAPAGALAAIAAIDQVQFVEEAPEITYRNSTTRWIVQSNVTNVTPVYDNGIHGEGQIVGVLDGQPDQNHCSLSGGKILVYHGAAGTDVHGTHVSATAVGDNGVNDNTRGIAYGANMVYNTIPAFSEAGITQRLNLHHSDGARIHTNSWGDDGTTSYNTLSRGFDVFMHNNEDDLVCLAVTNTASLKNPENAKNLLAVGASQDTPNQSNHCSGGTGPTADGRRKPEIYAPGCSTMSASAGTACSVTALTGTSMASPAVAGTAALVRQYFVDGYYPSGVATPADALVPSGALIKATLLNSAADMTGVAGYPSNLEGWGRVLADNALFFPGDGRTLVVLDDVRNAAGLSTSEMQEYLLSVSSATEQLRVTMVFTDAPASATTGTGSAAVNDLDLEVVSPTAVLYRGNVFSGGQSATGGTADTINNVEQVHINSPTVGNWTIRVRGTSVNQGPQGFALIATGDVAGTAAPLTVTVLDPIPATVPAGGTFTFTTQITNGTQMLVGGSPTLHYRFAAGAFQTVPLVAAGGDLYTGTVPAATCGDAPEFYVSADGDGGAVVTDPQAAPASVFSYAVGTRTTIVNDNMETDIGWTVSGTATAGQWERGIPANGSRGDPAADFDGSGQCYVTGNLAGDSDVDNGTTVLTSPVIDMSGGGTISYAYWLNDIAGGPLSPEDVYTVEVATDAAGTNWTQLRSFSGAQGAWRTDTIDITTETGPSATVRIRFTARDEGAQNVVEAGLIPWWRLAG